MSLLEKIKNHWVLMKKEWSIIKVPCTIISMGLFAVSLGIFGLLSGNEITILPYLAVGLSR